MGSLDRLRAARALLPDGAAGVGLGLLLLGASSYVYLTVAARMMHPAQFAGLSVLYTLVYTVGPGLFLPVEQELGRAIAHRRERGEGGGPVVRRAAALSSLFVVAVVVAVLPWWHSLTFRLFNGHDRLTGSLLVAMGALWIAHVTRGALAGLGRFDAYGRQLGVEGLTRAGLCVVLAVASVHDVDAYGLLLPVGLILSVAATWGHTPKILEPGPPAAWGELSHALALLLTGSLLAQVLVNAAPVATKVMSHPSQRAEAGRLLAGLVLARVPLFLFAAVQAALLPNLAAAMSRGDREAFVHGLRRLCTALLALSAFSLAVVLAVGPPLMRVLFGPLYVIGRPTLVELTAASALYMLAAVFAQSLVALRSYAATVVAWGLGVAAFAALLAAPGHLISRVSVAFLGGSGVAMVAAFGLLRGRWQRVGEPSDDIDLLPIATSAET